MDWKLAEAKNKLSEVVRLALEDGPQRVIRRKDAVMILSERDYLRLTGGRVSLKDFLMDGPTLDGLDLTRDRSPMRDAEMRDVEP